MEPALSPAQIAQELGQRREGVLQVLFDALVYVVAIGVLCLISLIFVFVTREAMPVILGQTNNARAGLALDTKEAANLPLEDLARYLNQPIDKLRKLSPDLVLALIELRADEISKQPFIDSGLNTTSWPMLLLPYRWEGSPTSEFIWQPNSLVPKYNIVPLVAGSLKIALIALVFAVPLGVASALYVSQIAPGWLREIVKPTIEVLAGFPTVVLGFFALLILATHLQEAFGYVHRLNSTVAGLMVALSIVPVIFTIAEEAITGVPVEHRNAAIALGASRWHASTRVVLPLAMPGVVASVLLGFSRAMGETMIVLMVSGNASILNWNPFDSSRTVPATIGAELAESVHGGDHYCILFLIGSILFAITFIANLLGHLIIDHFSSRLEARPIAERSSLKPHMLVEDLIR